MMFDRLVESIASGSHAAHQPHGQSLELQLATSIALVATMSADYIFRPEETRAVVDSLADLFSFDRKKCHKLLSRAMAARHRDPSIFNSAMMLRRLGTPDFNDRVLAAANRVAHADGELHDYEKDLLKRLTRILARKEQNALSS